MGPLLPFYVSATYLVNWPETSANLTALSGLIRLSTAGFSYYTVLSQD